MPESLLKSELFGHVKGSFTGAVHNKKGLFEVADKGTLWLDELVRPSRDAVKLLQALQEKTIRPVGGTEEIQWMSAVIAATNQDLQRAVQ